MTMNILEIKHCAKIVMITPLHLTNYAFYYLFNILLFIFIYISAYFKSCK